MLRKIVQLKAILESAEHESGLIKASIHQDQDDELNLELDSEDVSFVFDRTGEHFLYMLNWKE